MAGPTRSDTAEHLRLEQTRQGLRLLAEPGQALFLEILAQNPGNIFVIPAGADLHQRKAVLWGGSSDDAETVTQSLTQGAKSGLMAIRRRQLVQPLQNLAMNAESCCDEPMLQEQRWLSQGSYCGTLVQ